MNRTKIVAALVLAASIGIANADWQVSRTNDPKGDSAPISASVGASHGYVGALGDRRPATLSVRCQHDTLNTYVELKSFLPAGETQARIGFDESQAQDVAVSVSYDGNTARLHGGRDLLTSLSRHQKALLDLTAGENRFRMEFPLAGSAKAIAEVEATCRGGS